MNNKKIFNLPIILNLPNIITIGRILLVPVIIWTMLLDEFFVSFILFAVAGFSDFLDGWIARLQKIQTQLGAYLDPAADKLLMGSVYLTLGILDHIPIWLVLLVLGRDILIIGAVIFAKITHKIVQIAPLMVSKLNTLAQICLAILVLADLGMLLNLGMVRDIIYAVVGITTIISTFAYFTVWVKIIYNDE